MPENLVIPTGILSLSFSEYIASTPSLVAAFSDKSTTIAYTKTCALLISNFDTIFLVEFKLSSADEIIRELGFS